MPTGYTAAIKDGIDFTTFVLNCARAFGACVTLRDEPGGGDKIPESFEPDSYHLRAMESAINRKEELLTLSLAEAERRAKEEWESAEVRRLNALNEVYNLRGKYEEMLLRVEAWTPPTRIM